MDKLLKRRAERLKVQQEEEQEEQNAQEEEEDLSDAPKKIGVGASLGLFLRSSSKDRESAAKTNIKVMLMMQKVSGGSGVWGGRVDCAWVDGTVYHFSVNYYILVLYILIGLILFLLFCIVLYS